MSETGGMYTKWVASWGVATSIIEQKECRFAKDLTLRYPISMPFNGSHIRLHFSNLTGTEPVSFRAMVSQGIQGHEIQPDTAAGVMVNNDSLITIEAGKETVSDVIPFEVRKGDLLTVTLYMPDYTEMNSGVLITGPLSGGYYSYGCHINDQVLPIDYTRKTEWYWFLNTVDVLTEENNRALICFGDSITAQSWPDYLSMYLSGSHPDISVIRRAVSGTRILRQYDNITYAAYGLKGDTRFPVEMNVAGADAVLIQHGINDIIHPVGTAVNPFRPWSDLPTAEEMEEGFAEFYVKRAREAGLKVYGGTLLPIFGWRTYEPFREELKNEFNNWLRSTDLLDGVVDFDKALRDPQKPESFRKEYDSSDHLHPSEEGYIAMADTVMKELIEIRYGGNDKKY